MAKKFRYTRRFVLGGLATASWLGFGSAGRSAFAAGGELTPTPSQTEGPFYPVVKPPQPSHDLINVDGVGRIAEGVPLALQGRVLGVDGVPVAGAVVEIWQADNRGIYRHPRAPSQGREDPAFAGYGESVADAEGRYGFWTIVPVPYTGRPPHIHVKVRIRSEERLTTQLYLRDHADNDRDGLFSSLLFGNKDALSIEPRLSVKADGVAAQAAVFDFVV
ncbi:MAG: hypothetical protein ACR2RL_13280 [Gammaproteobacteria bacterium]